jgi:hypothetical protein
MEATSQYRFNDSCIDKYICFFSSQSIDLNNDKYTDLKYKLNGEKHGHILGVSMCAMLAIVAIIIAVACAAIPVVLYVAIPLAVVCVVFAALSVASLIRIRQITGFMKNLLHTAQDIKQHKQDILVKPQIEQGIENLRKQLRLAQARRDKARGTPQEGEENAVIAVILTDIEREKGELAHVGRRLQAAQGQPSAKKTDA